MRSTRRWTRGAFGFFRFGGRMNTVKAFSRLSQCAVRIAFGARKEERSGLGSIRG